MSLNLPLGSCSTQGSLVPNADTRRGKHVFAVRALRLDEFAPAANFGPLADLAANQVTQLLQRAAVVMCCIRRGSMNMISTHT